MTIEERLKKLISIQDAITNLNELQKKTNVSIDLMIALRGHRTEIIQSIVSDYHLLGGK